MRLARRLGVVRQPRGGFPSALHGHLPDGVRSYGRLRAWQRPRL